MRASPAGTCWVRLVVEEVGAQRSGNPYLWVSSYSVLNGYQVLCEGFIDAEGYEADQRPPVRWVGERELEVIFAAAKRRGSPPVVTRCQAP
jgi:hypothetical protein